MPAAAIICLVVAVLAAAIVLVAACPQYHGGLPMYMSVLGSFHMALQVVAPVSIATVWFPILILLRNRVLPRLATRTVVLASLAGQVVWTMAFITNFNSLPGHEAA